MNIERHYKTFDSGLTHYIDLYKKGLKKQANQSLSDFIHTFVSSLEEKALSDVLERFCLELCDVKQYTFLFERGNGNLPYELSRIIWKYLKAQCTLQRMPHMRWAFQIYGNTYNPFNPNWDVNMNDLLKKAYMHEQCDQETVNLYFGQQIYQLEWGAHHFPEGCIITRKVYADTVQEAECIMKEHHVNEIQVEKFHKLAKLYQCFYLYEESGRKRDFKQLCKGAGIDFYPSKKYYYV